MLKYNDFILEQNEEKEEDWKLSIDISKMWKQYEKGDVTLDKFNTAYINFLKNNQQLIEEKTGAWEKLNETLIKLEEKKEDEKGSFAIWDDIYDWGDGNLVEIKAENKSDF